MATKSPQILNYDVGAYLGDTLACSVTWKGADGVPINFTGATALGQLKVNKEDAAAVVALTITLGNAAENIKFGLTAAQVAALGIGVWFYDVQITHADGTVRTYIAGKIKTTQDVSR